MEIDHVRPPGVVLETPLGISCEVRCSGSASPPTAGRGSGLGCGWLVRCVGNAPTKRELGVKCLKSPVSEDRGAGECALGVFQNDLLVLVLTALVARSQWRAKMVRIS